jgi:hypothetical protein
MSDVKTEMIRQLLESCTTLARDLNSLRTMLGRTQSLLAEAHARGSHSQASDKRVSRAFGFLRPCGEKPVLSVVEGDRMRGMRCR